MSALGALEITGATIDGMYSLSTALDLAGCSDCERRDGCAGPEHCEQQQDDDGQVRRDG